MKHCALLLLAISIAPAQTYVNGMAARAVIGQKTFTAADIPAPASLPDLYQPGIGQWLLGSPSGIAYASGMLFVADSNNIAASPSNNRVLIYYDVKKVIPDAKISIPVPTGPGAVLCPVCTGVFGYQYGAAGTVLGQANFDSTDFGRSQSAMRTPTAVASDGKVLAVADTQNNRVLIWLTIPPPGKNNAPADVVIGSADFTSIRIGALDNKSVLGPQGLWIQDGRLYVADTKNHRVMVWNSIPTKNDTPADLVLGQKDFNTTSEVFVNQAPVPPAANRLRNPVSVSSDGKRLFVADLGYNRVLIWNSIPTSQDQPADVVLGQADMASDGTDPVTGALRRQHQALQPPLALTNHSDAQCDGLSSAMCGDPSVTPGGHHRWHPPVRRRRWLGSRSDLEHHPHSQRPTRQLRAGATRSDLRRADRYRRLLQS